MSYRSEIKKVIEKYYPQYKVETTYAPILHNLGITETEEIEITVRLKKNKKKIINK